jgi:hypothetical protein
MSKANYKKYSQYRTKQSLSLLFPRMYTCITVVFLVLLYLLDDVYTILFT